MTTQALFMTIIGSLVGVGLLVGGIGYFMKMFRKGGFEQKQESNDLINSNDQIKQFYKEQNDDLKEIIKVQGGKIETLTREVGEIRGQLTAETRQKEEYLLILKDRNPETKQFMEYMMQTAKDQQAVNSEMVRILSEIHVMAKAEHERDFHITATVSKDGDK